MRRGRCVKAAWQGQVFGHAAFHVQLNPFAGTRGPVAVAIVPGPVIAAAD